MILYIQGYGNVANVRRTVLNYAQAGLSGIMIEDQVSPKRCGHTSGREVVSREEAYKRIQSAVDTRRDYGLDIVILARTDARIISLEEALAILSWPNLISQLSSSSICNDAMMR